MEQNTIPARPSKVTTAIYMLYLSLAFPAVTAVLECSLSGGNSSDRIGMLATLPIVVLLYYMIGKGENWARIALLVLYILGVNLWVAESLSHPRVSGWQGISRLSLEIAELGVQLVALALLFQSASSDWFMAVSGPPMNMWNSMLALLRNTDQTVPSYVWRAWLIAITPAMVIGLIVSPIMPDKFPLFDGPLGITVVGALLVSPWAETLLMCPILWILKRIIRKTLWVAAVSAVLWGLLHSASVPEWGLIVTWPFFVFSLCFLEWEKISVGRAITVTALVHMCQNTIPTLAFVFSVLFGVQPSPQEGARPAPSPQNIEVGISTSDKVSRAGPSVQAVPPKETGGLGKEEKYRSFLMAFPQFGHEEFELANDDLYPDWKKNVAPNGTWEEFLSVYRDFVQWWWDRGSPQQPGLNLWKDFMASRK